MHAVLTWQGGWRIIRNASMDDTRITEILDNISSNGIVKHLTLDFEDDLSACFRRIIKTNAQDADEIAKLQRRIEELDHGFELRWQASQRAIKKWHEAGHPELEWPDHADLCVWLMGQLDKAKAVENAARGLLKLLEDVGNETEWRDKSQTDRVYAWYEFDELREALGETIDAVHEFK